MTPFINYFRSIRADDSAFRILACTGILTVSLASQLALAAGTVPAGIRSGSAADSGASDLFLTLIDPIQKFSYVLNLNIDAADFYIRAQQDTGSYYFLTLDPSKDSSLQGFVNAAGVDMANTRWAVMGVHYDAAASSTSTIYTTLQNDGIIATQTAKYDQLVSIPNGTLKGTVALKLGGWIKDQLNKGAPGSATPNVSTSLNDGTPLGSALSSGDTAATYASFDNGWTGNGSGLSGPGTCYTSFCPTNRVGTSSWFYQAKLSSPTNNLIKAAFDEFDNLTNDGYWGFIKDPNSSNYFLSYTLAGSTPVSLIQAAQGTAAYTAAIARVNSTDFASFSGSARLITVAEDDIANTVLPVATPLSTSLNVAPAVPEPQSWGLMALGGLLVAARARRQRRAH